MADKKQKNVIRPNVVDGIEEYDNPLPPWWVGLFNFTILFGLAYLLWFHVLDKPGLEDELAQEQKAYQQLAAAKQQQQAMTTNNPDELAARLKDPKLIEEGKGIYVANCSPCHGQAGEGTVGPNLTDKFWVHGGTPELVLGTINDGVPAMGMIAWGPILGQQKIESVTGYVLSLQGTNPPNGKAAQGDEY